MWGKIAQGLKENAGDIAGDLRGGLAKLQDVVAPPHVSRGDDDDDDDDDDHDDNDEYEYEEGEVKQPPRARVSFGAMLSRIVAPTALATESDEDDDDDEEEEDFVQVEESVEDLQQAPSLAAAATSSSKLAPFESSLPQDQTVVKSNTAPSSSAPSSRLVLPQRTPSITTKLVVPSVGVTKPAISPMPAVRKLIVPSKPYSPSAFSHQLSSISHDSLETASLAGPASTAVKAVEPVKSLQQQRQEQQQQPVMAQEDVQQLEQFHQDAVDMAVQNEQAAKILELEARELKLRETDLLLAGREEEKDNAIRQLEEQCRDLELRLRVDPDILQDKDATIRQLEAKCLELQQKPTVDPAVVKEKDDKIRELEAVCRSLQAKPLVDPEVVQEMSNTIRDLEAQLLAMQAQSTMAESAIVQEKDSLIQELEAKCHQMEEAQSIMESVLVQEKDVKIGELELQCQELHLEVKRQYDQAQLHAKQELVAKQQLEALEEQKQLESLKTLDVSVLKEKEDKILALEAQCQELHMEMKRQFDQARLHARHSSAADDSAAKELLSSLEKKCKGLEVELRQREDHIIIMQKDAAERMEAEEEWRESQRLKFKQEQAEMLEANAESVSAEYRQEIERLETELASISQATLDRLGQVRKQSAQKQRKLEQLLEETNARMAHIESEQESALSKTENANKQLLHKHETAARHAETKLIETKAMLEDRNEEVKSLKIMVKELTSSLRKSKESSTELQEELDHLREENETLHHNWQVTEDENDELKKQIDEMAKSDDVIADLRKQIESLKESKDRERAEIESKVDSVESNKSALQEERDAARATVRDLKHQLAAALADAEVAKADLERAIMGNENLSRALESFQSERDAEIAFFEERRMSSEEATAAAHAAAIQATHEANEVSMRQVRHAADAVVREVMEELRLIKDELEKVKNDKLQTRRSLDEAISRLQASQEDVVDRSLMKNVLLDWFARSGKSKEQVLEVMASLLHFSEDEKEKIHLYDGNRFTQVISSVATMPPAMTDVQHLEGANVRDKFVSFLLAETDDCR